MVFVHGGIYRFGYRTDCHNIGCGWAKQGVVTVVINYHLVPWGKWPTQAKDVAAAMRWTFENISKYGGDPNSIFMSGHSAGAHAVALVAAHPSYLSDEGVDKRKIRGVVSISGSRSDLRNIRTSLCCALFSKGSKGKREKEDATIYYHLLPDKYQPENASALKPYLPPLMLMCSNGESTPFKRTMREMHQVLFQAGFNVEFQALVCKTSFSLSTFHAITTLHSSHHYLP